MTPIVELIAARKRYGAIEALQGVDLCIRPGEVVALLGPNGAGKTTTISLMLGLRRPTSGSALLFGLDPTDRRARSRAGVMLQESGVMGVLTIRETIRLFRSYYPHPLPLGEILALAGLEEVAHQRVARLSGGQRQRLYFALAICGDPEALFLDEPTVGKDVETRRAVLESIRSLSTAGKTIVLTTHYLEEADRLASRLAIVDRGRVVATGSPDELKAELRGDAIVVELAEAIADQRAVAALARVPGVAESLVDGRSLRARADRGASAVPAVLSALEGAGIGVASVTVSRPSLDDVYLRHTGRAFRQTEESFA
jgi:ABC-2 type transport system ATP-binding protein